VIRDPIYGYVDVPLELMGIIDHRMFQRLRRVSQTSLTAYVYPTATGSRFEHALGVMHLADRAWKAVWSYLGDSEESRTVRAAFIEAARDDVNALPSAPDTFGKVMGLGFSAAALLHDGGHPPFSHALEEVFQNQILPLDYTFEGDAFNLGGKPVSFHEYAGRRIAAEICADVFVDPENMAVKNGVHVVALEILNAPTRSRTWAGALHGLIAGEVDIDPPLPPTRPSA